MFIRVLLSLFLLIPTLSVASDLTANCTIDKFTLNLSDFGIDKNDNPVDKSVGNHNPALILYFIKNTIIKDQAYSLEGQKFTLIQFTNNIEIKGQLIANNNPKLKPLIFNSAHNNCNTLNNNLVCDLSGNNGIDSELKISFSDNLSGTITAYSNPDNTPLTKHQFSCY